MAEKKPGIVIKKITIVQGGGHGGAWKVAFADFMTAMMAFFLVMWLMSTSSAEEKKAISEYFSTPSVIEYQFANYGAELTLEKLFLDLVNEPLKTFQAFVTPMDRTPNVMALGMKKVIQAQMKEQLGETASKMNVTADDIMFEIPDSQLFDKGSSNPNGLFINVMERVKGVTTGLEDSDVVVTSVVFNESVEGSDAIRAKNVAEERLDLIQAKVKASFENAGVGLKGFSLSKKDDRSASEKKGTGGGFIRIEIKKKKTASVKPEAKKPAVAVELKNTADESIDSTQQVQVQAPTAKAEPKAPTQEAADDVYSSIVDRVSKGHDRDPAQAFDKKLQKQAPADEAEAEHAE